MDNQEQQGGRPRVARSARAMAALPGLLTIDGRSVLASILDLSSSGMRLRTLADLHVGDAFALDTAIGSHKLSLACRVARVSAEGPEPEFGVTLLQDQPQCSPEHLGELKALLRRLHDLLGELAELKADQAIKGTVSTTPLSTVLATVEASHLGCSISLEDGCSTIVMADGLVLKILNGGRVLEDEGDLRRALGALCRAGDDTFSIERARLADSSHGFPPSQLLWDFLQRN